MTDADPVGSSSRTMQAFKRAQQEARVRSSGVGIPAYPANATPRSGIMPNAKGQVLCPHCHKGFGFSATLLNRQIRCNGCRGIFRVAEDRRSFKLQPPAPLPSGDVGTASHVARAAISVANSNLNDIAKRALRSIERQEQASPRRREGTGEHRAPQGTPGTARLARNRPSAPALTGDGLAEGRRQRTVRLVSAGVMLALLALIGAWWLVHDGSRMAALRDFQADRQTEQTWGERIAGLRSRCLGGRMQPVVGLDHARFGQTITLDLQGLRSALGGMRVLSRGELWVDAEHHDTAISQLAQGAAAASAALKKAGATVRTWAEVVSAAGAGQPSGCEDVLALMLDGAPPPGGGFDPVAAIDHGYLPASLRVCTFEGDDGALLQQGGRPLSKAYRGRLVRGVGAGWPDRWLLLDLSVTR